MTINTCQCSSNLGEAVNENDTGIFKLLDCLLIGDEKTKEDKERWKICVHMENVSPMMHLKKECKRTKKKATLRFIRNLMDSMGISGEEAMIKLQVPEKERSIFETLMKRKNALDHHLIRCVFNKYFIDENVI